MRNPITRTLHVVAPGGDKGVALGCSRKRWVARWVNPAFYSSLPEPLEAKLCTRKGCFGRAGL